MIKIICDKCGQEAGRVGYSIEVHSLHNASLMYLTDTGLPHITDDNSHINFTLCQDCYRAMKLPNIYKEIYWRDEE